MSELKPEPYPDGWESPRARQEAREADLLVKAAEALSQVEHMEVLNGHLRARLAQVEAERDAARQSAAAWGRSARMWRRSASAQAYDSQDCIGLDMSDWSDGVNYRFVREVYGDD